jgi:hypothetical protein
MEQAMCNKIPKDNETKTELKSSKEKITPLTLKGRNVTESSQQEIKSPKLSSHFPWLNEDGSRKSDNEISELGQTWSAETWNRYLGEDIGQLDDDEMVFFPHVDTIAIHDGAELLDSLKEIDDYQKLRFAVPHAVDELSYKQKIVIKNIFWSNKTIEEVAIDLKMTNTSVRSLKYRAIKRLKEILPTEEFKEKLKAIAKTDT